MRALPAAIVARHPTACEETTKPLVAEVRDFFSPDVEDLRNAELPEGFYINLQVDFGVKGQAGSDLFQIQTCDVRWIQDRVKEGIYPGLFHLVVERFDFEKIEEFLMEKAAECRGDSWEEIASELSYLGLWERSDSRISRSLLTP